MDKISGMERPVFDPKNPVFITFTPEAEEELGLSRPKDRVEWAGKNDLERSPEEDMFIIDSDMKCEPQTLAAFKAPTKAQVIKWLIKQLIKVIYNLYDTETEGSDSEDKHSIMAVVIPGEMAENFKNEISEKENLAA